MGLTVSVAPIIEPVTLSEVKAHLRLDTGSFSDEIASTISIAPDAWPITPAYGIVGAGVDVLNKSALFQFTVGTVAAGATLDYKIQESNVVGSGYVDWPGQSYTQITAAGTYAKAYTGIKPCARVVATVAAGAIDFGASVITGSYLTAEDTYITGLITTARRICENEARRSFITRTYVLYLDEFPPAGEEIILPMPPAATITSIVYTDVAGTATTWTATEYQLDTTGFTSRLRPAYGYDWPSTTLREMAGVAITYTAGYGATAASVPDEIRHALFMVIGDLYENRENSDTMERYRVPYSAQVLLGYDRVVMI